MEYSRRNKFKFNNSTRWLEYKILSMGRKEKKEMFGNSSLARLCKVPKKVFDYLYIWNFGLFKKVLRPQFGYGLIRLVVIFSKYQLVRVIIFVNGAPTGILH